MIRKGETFLQYKKRVIDPISPSFCAAKWLNASIWLYSGQTASCHHTTIHDIDLKKAKKNPRTLHNTEFKKKMRKLMLAGRRPDECSYCWRIEDAKGKNVSDRVFKTHIYEDTEIAELQTLDPNEDVTPKTLEIAFDRVCNFACSYCSPLFSSRWGQEIRRNGPYKGILSSDKRYYANDGSKHDRFPKPNQNPLVKSFWEWWPELSKSLLEIRITGGEPLMSKEVWKFFDYFRANPSSAMTFALNTNLGAPDSLIDRLIRESRSVGNLDIYTSCEAFGAQAEYVRDGLDFSKFTSNVERLLGEGKLRLLNFMMTVHALSLFSLTEFLELILELKRRYPKTLIFWNANILHTPDFMSLHALPKRILNERRKHLENWLLGRLSDPGMTEMDRENIQRLTRYLATTVSSRKTVLAEMRQLRLERDFKTFYEQFDKRRAKNIRAVFPDSFVKWYDSIPS